MTSNFLLDTNALSEASKKRPDSGFMSWFSNVDETRLYTSCLVLGEIKKGIALTTDSAKRAGFDALLNEIIESFDSRIITVDTAVALLWGKIVAVGKQQGRTPPVIDALIAAQCINHHLTLVTRNVKDFEQFEGLETICPWTHG